MKHILISYRDNPTLLLEKKILDNKRWVEFNDKGEEQFIKNSVSIPYILIQNCTRVEFDVATKATSIKYREIDDTELTEKSDIYLGKIYKLNITKALSKPIVFKSNSELKSKPCDLNKLKTTASSVTKSGYSLLKNASQPPKDEGVIMHFRTLTSGN